jgi:hypothetical protein
MSEYPGQCFVYLVCHEVEDKLVGPCKIGISDKPNKRLRQIQNGNPHRLTLAFTFRCWDRDWATRVEAAFHAGNASARMSGEWFNISAVDALSDLAEVFWIGLQTIGQGDQELAESLADACNIREAVTLLKNIQAAEAGGLN